MTELDLFVQSLAIDDPIERERYLDGVCEGQPTLRRRLDALLKSAFANHQSDRLPSMCADPPAPMRNFRSTANPTEPTSAPTTLPILSPRYELLNSIGEGGMGLVYKALDRQLNRVVAIKTFRPGVLVSSELFERFQSEALAIAKMQHPNIVQIHEVGGSDSQLYYAMEFLGGGSLAKTIKNGKVSTSAAVTIAHTIASVAAHAHSKGVVHRDLKPANVLYDAIGTLKVTDFGAARLFEPEEVKSLAQKGLTRTDMLIGTPDYMAPEQARGAAISPAVDIHAIGIILYEMLTSRLPFQGRDTFETLSAVIHDEPIPPLRLNRSVPKDLETICLKCLEKEPHRRYATATELADDLLRFQQGEPILAQPASLARRLWIQARKRPALSGSLLGSLLAGLIGVIALSWQFQRTLLERNSAKTHAERAESAREIMSRERDRAEYRLYVSRLNQALSLSEAGSLVRAKQLLNDCRPGGSQPDHRSWEWGYLARQTSPELWSLATAPNSAMKAVCPRHVALSPSGRVVASVSGYLYSDDLRWDLLVHATIQLVDADMGQTRSVWPDCLPVSAQLIVWLSESELLSIDQTGSVRCWDSASGRILREWPSEVHPKDVGSEPWPTVLSPSRKTVARNHGARSIAVWDVQQGQPVRVVPLRREAKLQHVIDEDRWVLRDSEGWFVASSKDGQEVVRFATLSDRSVVTANRDRLITFSHERTPASIVGWDIPSGRKIWENNSYHELTREFVLSPNQELGIQVLPDGHQHFARIWDIRNGVVLRELRAHSGRIVQARFSPDGLQVATCSEDGTLRTWNAYSGETLRVYRGHEATVRCFDYSPDGTLLVSGAMDHRLLAWDTSILTGPTLPGDYQHKVEEEGPLFAALSFTRDGTLRLLNTANGLLDVDPATGNPMAFRKVEGLGPRKMQFLHDFAGDSTASRFVGHCANRRELVVWNATTGAKIFSQPEVGGRVITVAISGDGASIACGAVEGEGQASRWVTSVWDVETQKCLYRDERPQPCLALGFRTDGKVLVRGSLHENKAQFDLIELPHGSALPLEVGDVGIPRLIRFSPAGQLILVSRTDSVFHLTCWDLEPFRSVWKTSSRSRISGLAFSPDGQRLAAGLMSDAVMLFNLATGEAILDLRANVNRHGDPAFPACVQFSPDGRFLAMNNSTNTFSVWEAAPIAEQPDERASRDQVVRKQSQYLNHLTMMKLARDTANRSAQKFHRERLQLFSPPTERLRELRAWLDDSP